MLWPLSCLEKSFLQITKSVELNREHIQNSEQERSMQFPQLSPNRKVISLACSQANFLGRVCPFSKIPFQFTQLMKKSTSLIAKPAIL